MENEIVRVNIENLKLDHEGRLRVHLVPMPSGDNPWRTQCDYRKEQRRDTFRFYLAIGTLGALILSVLADTAVGIWG